MTLDTATGPATRPSARRRRAAERVAPDPLALDRLLARQDGLITREQAVAAGVPAAQVDERLRRRRWRPVHPRVYLVGSARLDDGTRMRAALLWAGPSAVLSGPAAAWWHGLLADPPELPTVTVGPTAGRRGRARAGVGVRCRELAPVDVTTLGGIPVTALPVTVVETAVALGAGGQELLDRALRERVRFAAVREAHRRMGGAPGWARAGLLLASAAERSAAEAVRDLAGLLRATGARGWVPEPPVTGPAGTRSGGVRFPAAGVTVLVSGWAQPLPPVPVGRPGKVLRYCWHDLAARPTIVLAEIAAAVVSGPRG
jgi:hypothetical protein